MVSARGSGSPEKTAFTYHPKYLRLSKAFEVVKEIADWIMQKPPDSSGRENRFVGKGLDGITITTDSFAFALLLRRDE